MFDLYSRLKNPAIFQGNLHKKHYFEGWYFKQVGSGNTKIAIIPGISLSEKNRHSFIQVFDGRKGITHYFSYPIEDFIPEKNPFAIEVGGSRFSYNGVKLEIKEHVSIIGELRYNKITPFRYAWNERGVMGWYGFIPFMETYHGILSLDHFVNGKIEIKGVEYVFSDGKGYIEKDWGTSFPSSWIWMQSNSFSDPEISFMLSIAVIPWLRKSFIGHLAIIRIGDRIINLSTYKGANITLLEKSEDGVLIRIKSRKYLLEVNAFQGKSADLKSPKKGLMTGRTIESLDSRLKVCLRESDNSLLFDVGLNAGLEIMDFEDELIKGLNIKNSGS